jgi:hypothetical protein
MIAVGESKDRIENRAKRKVPCLDIGKNSERVPFSGTRRLRPGQQKGHASAGYYQA